jgi:hypothetical protein
MHYSNRAESDQHLVAIEGASKRTSSMLQFINLVFKHHCAVFEKDVDRYVLTADSSGSEISKPNEAYISRLFYENYFVVPRIHSQVTTTTSTISLDHFIEDTLEHPADSKKNRLKFLLGDVGCGKTAFVNFLLTTESQEWLKKRSIWFVRLDAHLRGRGKALSYEQLIRRLIAKTCEITSRMWELIGIPKEFAPLIALSTATNDSPGTPELALAEFFGEVKQRCGLRPFLIIDNLDQIYHDSDKDRFKGSPQANDTIDSIEKLISAFMQDGSPLGQVSANVLFVLRHETYDAVRSLERVFRPENYFRDNENASTIATPDWHEVMRKRTLLVKRIAGIYSGEGKEKDAEQVIRPILNDIEYRHPSSHFTLIEQLVEISNFGLRSVVEFFAKYAWIYPGHEGSNLVIERYLRQLPIGLLAFLLNKWTRYSQVRSLFPNIYLTPTENSHRHSYWLKRLIIEYIRNKERKQQEITFDSVLTVFCGPHNDGYPDDLVRDCLGSLAEAHGSNIIRPKLKISGNSHKTLKPSLLSMTRKGRHSTEHLFDKFIYLQLVVDDFELPIPNILYSEFKYDDALIYSYIAAPYAEYSEKVWKMIRFKARQVLIFIELLDVSYIYEDLMYPEVYSRLRALGIEINVAKMRQGVKLELERLSDRHNQLKAIIDDFFAYQPKLRKELDGFFLELQ